MDAWQIYLEELRQRGGRAAAQEIGREEMLTEAAHDAYRAAADRMTQQHGWNDEHTLVVMRGLNGAVQEWMSRPGTDWDELSAEMERRETELKNGL